MTFNPKPSSCQGCPACEWGKSFVPSVGPADATFLFLGQGPGEEEAHYHIPFYPEAQAGWRLTRWLYQAGLQRSDVLIGNAVQCWLPEAYRAGRPWGNRNPSLAELKWCWNAHVGPWLHEWHAKMCMPQLRPHHIFTVGVPSAKWILGLPWDKGAERYAGTSQQVQLPPIGENLHAPVE